MSRPTAPTRASVFAADLTAEGSQRLGQVDRSLRTRPLLFQMIWSVTGDTAGRVRGTLSSAVCAARAAGSRYVELYKVDLDNPDPAFARAVAQARGTASCP